MCPRAQSWACITTHTQLPQQNREPDTTKKSIRPEKNTRHGMMLQCHDLVPFCLCSEKTTAAMYAMHVEEKDHATTTTTSHVMKHHHHHTTQHQPQTNNDKKPGSPFNTATNNATTTSNLARTHMCACLVLSCLVVAGCLLRRLFTSPPFV